MKKVRHFARKWIQNLLKVVPHMVWEHKLVFMMFDLVLFLDGIKQEKGILSTFESLSYFSVEEVRESSQDFLLMCTEWLETGFSHSTSETLGVMQTYLVSKTRRKSSSLLDDNSDLMDLFTRFAKGSAISSAIIRSPSKHSRFLGEINGIVHMKEQEGFNRKEALVLLSKKVRDELKALYRSVDTDNFITNLHDVMFRSAALILINDTVETELVHLLCSLPKIQYSSSAMEIAVNAWAWVMASKPSLDRRMLAHMIQVWECVAEKREGLYSDLEE